MVDNELIPVPAHWPVRFAAHYNEPCDMVKGPCACGAWHDPYEAWVQDMVKQYGQGEM